MRPHVLVCPNDPALFEKLDDQSIVVKVKKVEEISSVAKEVRKHNRLFCVKVNFNGPLTAVKFTEEMRELPIALYVNSLGVMGDIYASLRILRNSNIKIFLNSDRRENFTAVKILASLGVSCGVFRGEKKMDWEVMNDLMTYAVYGKAPHAPVEPFNFVVSHYNPKEITSYNIVYFNNPQKYLHVTSEGQLALTHEDLVNGEFIGDLNALEGIRDNEKYNEKIDSWQQAFLSDDDSIQWPGWRLAEGNINDDDKKDEACKQFFSDFIDAAEFSKGKTQNRQKKVEAWQP